MSYLSRVTLRPTQAAKRNFVTEQIRPQYKDAQSTGATTQNPYRVHQALWQLFDLPPNSPRPFLYREYEQNGQLFYYVLSNIKPKADHPYFLVQTKVFNPQFFNGQRLAFELRANPVVTVRDETGRSSRHDMLAQAKRSVIKQGFDDAYSIDKAMFDAGVDWITHPRRMQSWGVIVHPDLELSAYTQHRFRRTKDDIARQVNGDMQKKTAVDKRIQFSSLDYAGVIEIQDAELFYEQMLKGFGKKKAFGCGLMLVRPLRQ